VVKLCSSRTNKGAPRAILSHLTALNDMR
jgi:hypothetical protein